MVQRVSTVAFEAGREAACYFRDRRRSPGCYPADL
jgi:hypothetical protein